MKPVDVYLAEQARKIDRAAIESCAIPGIDLMRRAGKSAFDHVMATYSRINHMVVVCGPGNNGGDGYVIALHARKIGIPVTVLAPSSPATDDAATACQDYLDHGGTITQTDYSVLDNADLVIDALFGTGLSRAPQGVAAKLIDRINSSQHPVVSIDIPSGLHSDTGVAFRPCVVADMTVTFIGLKLGLLTGQGRSHVGRLLFEDLNVPPEAYRSVLPAVRIIQSPVLPQRFRDSHKGNAGRVLVVGGGGGMLGAVVMAGEAALRCGSGLVTIASTPAHLDLSALRCPALMTVDALSDRAATEAEHADAIVLGPGLGQSDWSEQVFERYAQTSAPKVVDADGLNWLASNPCQRSDWVLTPHPGEAARLLQCSVAEVQSDRLGAGGEISAKFGGVCVLKGAGTLVICPQTGDYLCDKGNPGMATAGMGDVLSGMIGSLLGQGLAAGEAATAAVWFHSHAADIAAVKEGERSLLATDVIDQVSALIRQAEQS